MSAGARRVAARKCTLIHESVSRAAPRQRPYVIWDDKVIGLGLRISPGGTKSFFVQCRTGPGGVPTRIARLPWGVSRSCRRPMRESAHRRSSVRCATGGDPSQARARARALPTLAEAVEDWLRIKEPHVAASTMVMYRRGARVAVAGWHTRRLDRLTREDIAARFEEVTRKHGKVEANVGIKVLAAMYRRAAVDHPGLPDPVARWKHAGGRVHRIERRRIDAPSEVLPAWAHGMEHGVRTPQLRDVFWFGMYTGMRLGEVLDLRWDRVDADACAFRVEETKTGEPLVLPITSSSTVCWCDVGRRAPADRRQWESPGCSRHRSAPAAHRTVNK